VNKTTNITTENPIVGFIFELGCDAPNNYRVLRLIRSVADDYYIEKLVEEHMKYTKTEEWNRLAKETGAEQVPDTRLTWYGWKFNREGWEVIWGMVQKKENLRKTEQDLKDEQKRKKRDVAFLTAKQTNTPQVLSSWMEDCNDPEEQCSLDHVTVYAMPNGTTKKERQHMY